MSLKKCYPVLKLMKDVRTYALMFVSLSFLVLTACNKESQTVKSESIVKETVAKKLPRLLDLGAEKCIPCKKLAPILAELEKEYKGVMDVEFVDVWEPENKEIAMKYKIQSIPTQIYFDRDGKEIWRHVGFISKEELLAKWKELGYEFNLPPVELK